MIAIPRKSKAVWLKLPLGELCEVNIGRTPARERRDYWGTGHLWLSIADMNQGRNLKTTKETITDLAVRECNCRLAPVGTVLLSFKLSIGKVGIARVPLFTNEAIAALPIRDESKLIPDYLYWALQSIDLTLGIDRAAKGLTLNKAKLLEVEIPLPPLEEQRRIAEVLDRAEELRSKRREALAQLDTLTQAIFIEMFGDPATNLKGWDIQPISAYVAQFQGGKSIEAESGENIVTRNRVLKVSAVTQMKFRPEESKPLPDSYEPSPEHFVRAGDLLFSRANTTEMVGAVAYVKTSPLNLLLPDKLWRFVWKQPVKVLPLFVWVLFQTSAMRQEIGKRATGTSGSMKNISQEKLLGIKTIVPPLHLQQEFAHRAEAVEKLKASHRASLSELDALFASLQHRAFRGEL
jgi:type I restriction enzyme S subunit